MRLDLLADLRLTYRAPLTLVRPYGTGEGSGYGEGDGSFEGPKLRGEFRWVNHPHRRSDGRFLPDLHALVSTHDGATLLFHMSGRTQFGENNQGRQLLTILFETEDPRYTWLNDSLCVVEGIVEPPSMRAKLFACIHEFA
jgi:hypothetical protein